MRMRMAWGSVLAVCLAAAPVIAGRAARKEALEQAQAWHTRIAKDQETLHALQRLTFGPRPGDVEAVRAMGLTKWIDLQLHPERIPENPVLEAKLAPLTSLRMSTEDMLSNYPPPQAIKAMLDGRLPLPSDPQKRQMVQAYMERYRDRQEKKKAKDDGKQVAGDAKAAGDEEPMKGEDNDPQAAARELRMVLGEDRFRSFRQGSLADKIALLQSLPPRQLADVVIALPQKQRRALFAAAPVELRRTLLQAAAPGQVLAHDLYEAKIDRALYSNRQWQEVLVDFWYNHFNIFLDKGADRYLVTAYERDAIRPHVLGSFRDLVLATAQSPAMLFYLDNAQSVDPQAMAELTERRQERMRRRGVDPQNSPLGKLVGKGKTRGLNENYARELMELHTLGVDGGYTQKDVTEVARCFTGWTIRNPRQGGGFFFHEQVHDRGEKTVLGVRIPAGGGKEDGLKVIDLLVRQPATAKHIARQLAQRFVADNPPDSLVAAMAATFQKSQGDIRAVLRTMVDSPEFWSTDAYRAKVKSPFEMVVSAVRAIGADVDNGSLLAQQVGQLGQPLYRKQEPTGYKNISDEWVSSAALLGRMNFALALTQNKLPGVRVPQWPQVGEADPARLALQLILGELSPATLGAIHKNLQERQEPATPALVAALVLGSPEFQRR